MVTNLLRQFVICQPYALTLTPEPRRQFDERIAIFNKRFFFATQFAITISPQQQSSLR
jgi:hypothetical protein